jgi:ribosome-binding factor A
VPGKRRDRIARVIREEASRVILYELADPRIGFVTVTKVKVSGDLQQARVFVSVLGKEGDRTKTMHALARASKVVRRAVAPRLKTRLVPSISFEFDESVEGAIRVEGLIRQARATDSDAQERESEEGGKPEGTEGPAPSADGVEEAGGPQEG